MDESLKRKYSILKARINNLIEEHADALALAQYYAERCRELEEKMNDNVEQKKVDSPKG